jgi:NADPH-dependent 2,4-dienoyl-CoA reductase/sulfur reductase-like enzyme
MAMTSPIVIVGGGVAAARVVRTYREAGGEAPLTVISADGDPPYNRPPLSKAFLRGEVEADAVFVEPPGAYAGLRVDLRLGSTVAGVDPRRRAVTLADGETLGYERLVLATGALPRTLGAPGEDLEGVHTFRTLADARAVREAATSAERALVVGGGFIGMETAASLRRRGLEVTQIDRAGGLFAALQAPALSRSLERLYRERGIELILGDTVAELRGSGGRLRGAVTRGGRELAAELAIVGAGVTPSTAYLDGSGLALDRGAIVVDERFATSQAGIYAIGDVASFFDPVFGHRRLVQHWTNADHHGARLGRLLAGEDAPYDLVAYFFSEVFGTKIGLFGDLDGGHDELVVQGSLDEGHLLGFYLRDDRLVATLVVGQTAETQAELTALLRRHARVRDRAPLADEGAPVAAGFHGGA